MGSFWRALAAALVLAAAPAASQPQPRVLEVPATKSWQHAATGMILPPTAAGLSRGSLVDRTAAEQDVSADYGGEDGLTTSVYIFQTPLPDPALWADRAFAAILLRPEFGLDPAAPAAAAAPYRRPGAAAAGGIRATFKLDGSGLTATALAVVPLQGWLVKVRMTSARLDPAALDARMTAFLEALRWPAEAKPAPAAAPVVPCRDSLAFKKAKIVPNDMGNALMDAISGTVELDQVEEGKADPVVYCREPGPHAPIGLYRPDGRRDSYVIALGDSGRALRLAPALTLDLSSGGSAGRRVAMTLLEHDRTTVLPSFNRLPSPEQAMAVAFSGRPRETISITTTPGEKD
ncbi:MAG TPA: hypothetical protein VF547_00335 [Allosphingosinicella sp.]|jgi:hypothetical protein